MKNIIIHIPHDGNIFPKDLIQNITIGQKEFEKFHREISDRYISKLTEGSDYSVLKFSVSRTLCDVERFLENEVMEEYGMGFCYQKTHEGKIFKKIDEDVLNRTKKYYLVHHKKFDDIAKSFEGKAWTIIDLHSFHKNVIVRELTEHELPEICIGYEKDFCDRKFLETAVKHFRNFGYKVSVNYPYEGSFVPNIVYSGGLKTQLNSIMIEVNKTCYLDQKFEIDDCKFNKLNNAFKSYINKLVDFSQPQVSSADISK